MGGDKTCYIDRLWVLAAKAHGMKPEGFGITEDNIQHYCNSCENWDCHVKRKSDKRSEGIWVKRV